MKMETLESRLLLLCGVVAVLQLPDNTVLGVCEPPYCYRNNGNETPCTSCPVGSGVAVVDGDLQYCQTYPHPRDTDCQPCKDGYFSDIDSPAKKCKICVRCHSTSEEIVQNCTANHNYVCQCKQGAYFKENNTYCKACRPACGLDEEEIEACTPDHDRLCGPRRTTPPAMPEVRTVVTSTTKVTTNSTSKPELDTTTSSVVTYDNATPRTGAPTHGNKPDQGLIWIAGVVVGCVVLIIAVIAFISYCRNRTRNGRVCGGSQQSQPDGSGRLCNILCCVVNSGNSNVHNNYVPASSHPNGLPNGYGHRVQNGVVPGAATRQYEMESGPNLPNGHAAAESDDPLLNNPSYGRHNEIPLRSPSVLPTQELFPDAIRQNLIRKLDKEDALVRDWRWFATHKFGLTTDEMEEWESSGSPAARVLRRWEKDRRTVAEFRRCLKEMERDDIADDILPQEGDEEEETGEERELENYASGSSEV